MRPRIKHLLITLLHILTRPSRRDHHRRLFPTDQVGKVALSLLLLCDAKEIEEARIYVQKTRYRLALELIIILLAAVFMPKTTSCRLQSRTWEDDVRNKAKRLIDS